jgi:Holliday junction DNA helicase RuvA
VRKDLTEAVVRSGGVGYSVSIPVGTYEKLPAVGGSVLLYTHLVVREDDLRLFGFASEMERVLFRMLIGAKGIGPSTALAIMSGSTIENFSSAVAEEDHEALERIRGIGAKTARRIVAEIKDDMVAFRERYLAGALPAATVERDAVLALVSLGFPRNAAEKAVQKARTEQPAAGIEELVRDVLRGAGG